MSHLLLVEDDQSLGLTLRDRLQKEGYKVDWVQTRDLARQTLEQCRKNHTAIDVIILDIGLPDGSGLDLGRDVRMQSDIPIIFLSAMSSAEYRLEGFELGAEDYIPKPFHLKELLLRIARVLQQRGERASRLFLECVGFKLDLGAMAVVFADGVREPLGKRDFELLRFLIQAAPQVVSREDVLQQVWRGDTSQTGRSVDNAVVRLRQLLRRADSDCIRSVRGIGYQWLQAQP